MDPLCLGLLPFSFLRYLHHAWGGLPVAKDSLPCTEQQAFLRALLPPVEEDRAPVRRLHKQGHGAKVHPSAKRSMSVPELLAAEYGLTRWANP